MQSKGGKNDLVDDTLFVFTQWRPGPDPSRNTWSFYVRLPDEQAKYNLQVLLNV